MHLLRRLKVPALAAVLFGAATAGASADTSIGTGIFFPSDGGSNGALVGSLALNSIPGLPIRPQVTGVLVGGGGGRYAVTGEAEFAVGRGLAGVGAGVGKMSATGQSGLIFDAFGSVPVVPHLSLDARLYGAGNGSVGSGGYLGLSLHI